MVRRLGTLVLLGGALLALPSPAHGAARLDADLRGDLARSVSGPITLFVHGTSVARVKRAGDRHGFKALGQWPAIDTVMLRGPRRGVVRLRRERGLRFIEGDRRFIPLSGTATQASRAVNLGSYTDPSGLAVDGRGVSAAIVDTGVDGTHPFFSNDGRSRVVRNLKVACFGVTLPSDLCYVDSGPANDTDTASTGGHGTHVAGIVAGRPVTTTLFNLPVRGTAPGASLVSISGGQLISMALNLSAQEWVLKHHAAPCGAAASAAACPPIRVVNHSWGPSGGGTFAEGSAILERDDYRYRAELAADFALKNLRRDGRLLRTYKDGQARLNGYLEDYAFLADGLLALYTTTFAPHWLEEARSITEGMLELFWDDAAGGFYDTGHDHEKLVARPRSLTDNAVPSGNSVAAEVLLRLASVYDTPAWSERALVILAGVRELLRQYPTAAGRYLCALDFALATPQEIAIVGEPLGRDTQALIATVRSRFRPNIVIALRQPGAREQAQPALLRSRNLIEGQATAYVCERYACQQPVTAPRDLAAQLGD